MRTSMPGEFSAGGNDTKYRKPTNDRDDYHWYGDDSRLPIKNPGRALKREELENLVINNDFKCKLFDCSNADDMAQFEDIMDKVYNGWYAITKRLDNWAANKSHPVIWLEWVIRYRTVNNPRAR
jgi:hypothetical protein